MLNFLKTTCLGGVIFLVPVVIFIAVMGEAFTLVSRVAAPVAAVLPVDSVGGMAIVHIVALLILVFICFLAGLAAKTRFAVRVVDLLEENILDKVPAYALMKTKAGSILSAEDAEDMTPVLIQFDDSWQLAYEVERLEEEKVLVFLPGAPDPWSGSVCVVTADRVTRLDLNIKAVAGLMKRVGKGYGSAIQAKASEATHGANGLAP